MKEHIYAHNCLLSKQTFESSRLSFYVFKIDLLKHPHSKLVNIN